jgi:hypothetical protein
MFNDFYLVLSFKRFRNSFMESHPLYQVHCFFLIFPEDILQPLWVYRRAYLLSAEYNTGSDYLTGFTLFAVF